MPATGYLNAEAFVRSHQWDEAIKVLLPLAAKYPRNLKLLNLTGLAYTGKGDMTRADIYFARALKVDPAFVPALKNLGINEYNVQAFPKSEQHLQAAADHAPDDEVIHLFLGKTLYARHKFDKAARSLEKADGFLDRDPDTKAALAISYLSIGESDKAQALLDELPADKLAPESQFAVGVALGQADLPDRALTYLEALARAYPNSYEAGFDLTLSYVQAKAFAKAITLGNSLIAGDHETAELDNVLAEAYEGNHDTQHAVEALRRAISLDPNSVDNYLDFASLCMDHREFGKGLIVVQVGLEAQPQSERLIFLRGVLYAMQDKFDLAEKDFDEASKIAPDNSLGFVGLGVTYLETGNAKEAAQILKQRLRNDPNDASVLYLYGEALLKSGAAPGDKDYAEATSSLESAVRLNPKLCLPHVSLGNIYLTEGKTQDAAAQFEQARLIDPNENSAYSHLAVAYRRLGQPDKAKEVLAALKEVLDQQREGGRARAKLPGQLSSQSIPASAQP